MRAAVEDQQPKIGAGLENGLARFAVGVARGSVLYEFSSNHEASAADVADAWVLRHDFPEGGQQFLAAGSRVGDESLLRYGPEDGHAGGAGHRIASERGAMSADAPRLLELAPADDSPEGQSVGESLGHAHNVRDDARIFEGPHPTRTRNASLNLV